MVVISAIRKFPDCYYSMKMEVKEGQVTFPQPSFTHSTASCQQATFSTIFFFKFVY